MLENGKVVYTSGNAKPEFQDNARVLCNNGYEIYNDRLLTCNATGKWSSKLPTCKGEFMLSFMNYVTLNDWIQPNFNLIYWIWVAEVCVV